MTESQNFRYFLFFLYTLLYTCRSQLGLQGDDSDDVLSTTVTTAMLEVY